MKSLHVPELKDSKLLVSLLVSSPQSARAGDSQSKKLGKEGKRLAWLEEIAGQISGKKPNVQWKLGQITWQGYRDVWFCKVRVRKVVLRLELNLARSTKDGRASTGTLTRKGRPNMASDKQCC